MNLTSFSQIPWGNTLSYKRLVLLLILLLVLSHVVWQYGQELAAASLFEKYLPTFEGEDLTPGFEGGHELHGANQAKSTAAKPVRPDLIASGSESGDGSEQEDSASSWRIPEVDDFDSEETDIRLHPNPENHITDSNNQGAASVGKVTLVFPGETNPHFDCALRSHQRQAEQHGYKTFILETNNQISTPRHSNPVANFYWNKPYYLLSLLVQELAKDPAERLQWLMWFDADSIILNPSLPMSLFLPPPDFDDTHFLVTKDWNGVNNGIFLMRVHQVSAQIVAKSLTYPDWKPEVGLGWSADQTALSLVFNETQFRQNVVYIPRLWINEYKGEPQPGDLLIHFAGVHDKNPDLKEWCSLVEGNQAAEWNISPENTVYPAKVATFWERLRHAKRVEVSSRERAQVESVSQMFADALAWVQDVIYYRSDEEEQIDGALERLTKVAFQESKGTLKYLEDMAGYSSSDKSSEVGETLSKIKDAVEESKSGSVLDLIGGGQGGG